MHSAAHPLALLEALHAAGHLEGYGITRNGEWTVEVTYLDEDGSETHPSGTGNTLEWALSGALRNCPARVQELATPALLRWSLDRQESIHSARGVAFRG